MNTNEKNLLKQTLHTNYNIEFFKHGILRILSGKQSVIISVCIIILFFCAMYLYNKASTLFGVMHSLIGYLLIFTSLIILFTAITTLGKPHNYFPVMMNIRRIGLRNVIDESPILVSDTAQDTNTGSRLMEFVCYGISLDTWERYRTELESTLNICIINITLGKDNRHVLVSYVPANSSWEEPIPWDDTIIDSTKPTTIRLGQGVSGTAIWNIVQQPHALIGGSTGSGKTILLKIIIRQALILNMSVVIVDLKGGIDFPDTPSNVIKCLNFTEIKDMLFQIKMEMDNRLSYLRYYKCSNIDEYNERIGSSLPHCLIIVDELAELFDTTGATKSEKAELAEIERKIAMIARMGRAFGIHLVLATQRPDANILPGQIKNNLDFRVCGRSDNILSQIVLDNTDAATAIPSYSQGRFLTNDGTIFQAYWFTDKGLK